MAKQLATDSRPSELTTKPRKRDFSASTIPLSKVAAELAAKTDMTKKDATGALEDFIDLVVKHLKKGNKVRITGLGILQVRNRPARMGRNPATGEAIKIKAAKKVSFRAAKDLKDVV
jgi:DNA-binding protein HU-beta